MLPMFYSSLPRPAKLVVCSPWLGTAVPLILAAVCYWNGLGGELVHDDIFAIKDNLDLRPSAAISQLFWNDFWGKPMSSNVSHKSYRPLVALTFRINYALHELRPWGYHVVNVALHMLVTALFGYFCRVTVFRGCGDLVFLATTLFATHPVHTEAVTGVVGRADILACLFFLLALLAYRGSISEEGLGGGGRWIKLLASVVCGCVAMLCKEHGVTVFAVCFAYDLLIASRKAVESAIKARNPCVPGVPQLIARMAVVGVLVAPLLIFRIMILPGPLKTPQFSAQDNPASFAEQRQTRVLTYSYLYYFNAKLLVAPITLCYDWQMGSIPLLETVMDTRNAGTVAFFVYLVGLSVFCLLGKPSSRRTAPLLGLLLLVIPFLPAANLLLRVGFVVAERILYIPSMGYCILLVSGVKVLSGLGRRRLLHGPPSSSPSSPSPSTLPFYLTLMLVVLFGMRTVTRNPVWHTRESLFKSGLETVPNNAKIHFNYGNFLRDSQRTEEAIQHYRTAISLAPDHAVSHNNLGTLLELEEAEFHFREAVHHNPQHHRAFYNLGRNLETRGRMAEAEAAYRESIDINPAYSDALMGIAMAMAESGRVEQGWEYMRRASEAAPDKPDVHNNMGAYLLKMNQTDEAVAAYEKTLQLNPRHTTALTSLARIYRKQGRNDRAEETFKRALSIDRDPSTLHYLGALYFNTGKYTAAAATFQEAVSIDPARVDSTCSCAQALIRLSKDDEAMKVLTQAIQMHPSAACPHVVLASVYTQQKLFQKVLEHSSMAIRLSEPGAAAEAYHLHGGALKDLGRLQEAEESYREAVSLAPHMAAARINLGAVLHMRNNYSAAREQYEEALRLDPSNKPLIHENLKKLDRVQKLVK